MKTDNFIYLYKGKEVNVRVIRRPQKNTYFRYRKDGFYITCPYLLSNKKIIEGLDKYADKLVKYFEKRNDHFSLEEDYLFLLGEKVQLSALNLKNSQEIMQFLKNKFSEVLHDLVRKNEKNMGILEPYKISIKQTVSQFGSNSKKTHTLCFQLNLVHYSKEIIESVVIHELAHDEYRNHQKEFYNLIYKYCPDYELLQRKLKKGVHK